jgi:hemerythrin-like domain-containing protein
MRNAGEGRRDFLAGVAGAGAVLISSAAAHAEAKKRGASREMAPKGDEAGDVPPTEDLMREHGVLRRILLVYEEAIRKLASGDAAVVDVIAGAANIVQRFVEGYHEKLEEDFVFPALEKAGKLVDLTQVLRVQHAAGRKVTDAIREGATQKSLGAERRRSLTANIQSFVRMYAPHAAWEDTDLFPVFRQLYTEAALDRLGAQFEAQEHKLLGGGGFEGSLKEVGDLEKALGIHDLGKFTPGV